MVAVAVLVAVVAVVAVVALVVAVAAAAVSTEVITIQRSRSGFIAVFSNGT